MRRSLLALLCLFILRCCAACSGSSGSSLQGGVVIQVANGFSTIQAGGAPQTLTATVTGDSGNQGVTWTLSVAGAACSPGCGTLKPAPPPSLSAVYTPPATVPLNQEATITVRSLANDQQVFVFNFQIVPAIAVSISTKFASVNVGGPVQNLSATVSNDSTNAGLTWTLTASGANCQPGCGVLTADPIPSLTAHYTPPSTPPTAANASPTITATSNADNTKKDSFSFMIVTPSISVMIVNKFTTASTGGQPVTVNASITNDFLNQGVSWTLTAGGAPCTSACGTLTAIGSPSTSATYTPPATPPSGASANPTITATSVSDMSKSDSFSFTIVTPPIGVSIVNKFQSAFDGGQTIIINVSLMNDFLNEGVSWSLSAGGTLCPTACGTLTPFGTPSAGATYTPPATPQSGANATPTITATSVADPTKSDSFTFSLVFPPSLVSGRYAFLLRGYDQSLRPMAMAGSLTADGQGTITGGEYDLNDNGTVTRVSSPLGGNYTVDVSFSNIPRVSFVIAGPSGNIILTCALSADGKRAKAIELDSSLNLNAGSLIFQDPAAIAGLATSASPTNFSFGLDSDAPINGRVVEAGQFILGPGALNVYGGIADEAQAGAANPVFGGVAGPATIVASSSAATPPDASGRGTLTFSIAGSSTQYAYYVVNSSQLNLIEIDAGGALQTLQAGTAMNQSALSANSINATSVAALTGMTTVAGAPSPDVVIGVLSNSAGAAPTVEFDSNNAGTVATAQTATGSVAVPFDPTTGRCVISGAFFPDAVLYLYANGSGFIADITPAANGVNHGFSGPLVLQTAPTGGFVTQSLSGNSIALAGASSSSSMTNLDLAVNYDGVGDYMAMFDFTVSNLNVGLNGQGQSILLNGATYRIDDPIAGRGELLQVPSGFFNNFPVQGDAMSFYMIGPNQFVAIEELGLSPSGIMFFDPQ